MRDAGSGKLKAETENRELKAESWKLEAGSWKQLQTATSR
jgi:hypothetical protein